MHQGNRRWSLPDVRAFLFPLVLVGVIAAHELIAIFTLQSQGESWVSRATYGDGHYYVGIAQHGYSYNPEKPQSNLAFFPVYPLLIKTVGLVMPVHVAALLIPPVCAVIAALALRALLKPVYGSGVGAATSWLWIAQLYGIVFISALAEAVVTMVVVLALLLWQRERYVFTALLVLSAFLTKHVGMSVAAGIGIMIFVGLYRQTQPLTWRRGLVLLVCVLGPWVWPGYVATRTGNLTGYYQIQRAWRNGFDPGTAFVQSSLQAFTTHSRNQWRLIEVAVACAALVTLTLVWVIRDKQSPAEWKICALLMIFLSLAHVSYFASNQRLLVPLVFAYIPVGCWCVRRGPIIRNIFFGFWMSGALVSTYAVLRWWPWSI